MEREISGDSSPGYPKVGGQKDNESSQEAGKEWTVRWNGGGGTRHEGSGRQWNACFQSGVESKRVTGCWRPSGVRTEVDC